MSPNYHMSDLHALTTRTRLPIAPTFLGDVAEGIRQSLESFLLRYSPALDGVLLSYSWPVSLIGNGNCPVATPTAFTVVEFEWQAIIWRPIIGKSYNGRISLSSPSNISLLLHDLFNASISSLHIPDDTWVFDHDVDPPYLTTPTLIEAPTAPESDPEDSFPSTTSKTSSGCWVNRITRQPLGGQDGRLEFTVVGLTIANSMMSIHASLLPDPFSAPVHPTLSPAVTTTTKKRKATQSRIQAQESPEDIMLNARPPTPPPSGIPSSTPSKPPKKKKKSDKEGKKKKSSSQ